MVQYKCNKEEIVLINNVKKEGKKTMRKFNLTMNNGVVESIPTTLTTEQVMERLNARKGGFMHIVAYTDAKPLKKARTEGMDLVKITDCMCINGLPKMPKTEETEETTSTRPAYFTRINYALIQYNKSGEIAIQPHMSNNPKHKAVSYYIDRNSGIKYDKQYLIDNGYISSATSTYQPNQPKWLSFKLNNIIYIR